MTVVEDPSQGVDKSETYNRRIRHRNNTIPFNVRINKSYHVEIDSYQGIQIVHKSTLVEEVKNKMFRRLYQI